MKQRRGRRDLSRAPSIVHGNSPTRASRIDDRGRDGYLPSVVSQAPPRIAVVSADRGVALRGPGGGVHLRGLAAGLRRAGAEVAVFAARLDGPGPPAPLPDVSITPLRRGRCPGVLRRRSRLLDLRVDARAASRRAVRAVRRFGPSLVYERYALFADAGRRIRRDAGVPWVLEVNAPRAWEAALFEGLPVTRRMIEAETALLRAADRVVVVSAALEAWVRARGVAADRVALVPNGASASPAAPPRGPFRIGYAGTFKPWHRLPESVPALARLASERGPTVLELHGDGPDRARLIAALEGVSIRVEDRSWAAPDTLDAARTRWHVAWVPAPAAWPPDPDRARRLEDLLGEPCPARWFDPLKGAEARAAGLPVWTGGDAPPALDPRPVEGWTSTAAAAVGGLQWNDPRSLAGSRMWTALAGVAGGAPR